MQSEVAQTHALETRRPQVLFVDDEEAFRYAATKALEGAGFAVTAVADYRGALDALDAHASVDVMVTDVVMPKHIHGFALARMARMRRPGLKVIYLTAYDVPTNEAAGKVLRKPISDEQLVDEVRAVLAG